MLRAITSYFFGETQDQTLEAPIDCETREVNDWLVVNLPDQNKEEVDLNDEDNTNEKDGDGISEVDGDDTTEVDESELDEDDLSESDEDDTTDVDATEIWPAGKWDDTYDRLQRLMALSNFESEIPRYNKGAIHPSEIMGLYCPYLHYVVPPFIAASSLRKDYGEPETQQLTPVQKNPQYQMVTAHIRRTQGKRVVNEFERKFKIFKSQNTITCPSVTMTSKDYYNHRHPEKPQHNADLLQRIKELEPEQQAVQRSIRKNITRGQLNRQNKNYMYDTSSKKNRRCNRQRNHSGANNNRKC